MFVLQVTNLTVRYPDRPVVVDGVSLSIDAGEIVGVSGPSGCGKTTLALAVLGLLPEDAAVSGSIRFGDHELLAMREDALQTIRGAGIARVPGIGNGTDSLTHGRCAEVVEETQHSQGVPVALGAARTSKAERMTSTNEPIVEIIGLERTYRRRRVFGQPATPVEALRGVDLTIVRGATVGLTGRSGCGKSTLARCIAGLESPDAGEIHIEGMAISQLRGRALLPYQNHVQVIFQDSSAALNPRFTALDVVSEAMVIQGIGTPAERRDLSAELMTLVGLSPDRLESQPHQFSGGERQRLAIARALVSGPRVLILDEAFSGLDLRTRAHIVHLLEELKATQGLTYVCISHDRELLASFATEVVVMEDGRIETPQHQLELAGAVA